jgi:hypothetical protein
MALHGLVDILLFLNLVLYVTSLYRPLLFPLHFEHSVHCVQKKRDLRDKEGTRDWGIYTFFAPS